jgi:hypothetical protein
MLSKTVLKWLKDHGDFEKAEDGGIVCTLTGVKLGVNIQTLNQYINGAKYKEH